MQRPHAERRRDAGATATTAAGHRVIPRVSADTCERAIADPFPAELAHRGLAEEHCAMLARSCDDRRIFGGRAVIGDRAGAFQRRPALREPLVLDGTPHAVEQAAGRAALPSRLGLPGGGQCQIWVDQAEGVHRFVAGGDAVEHRARRLHRGDGLAAVALQQRGRRQHSQGTCADCHRAANTRPTRRRHGSSSNGCVAGPSSRRPAIVPAWASPITGPA